MVKRRLDTVVESCYYLINAESDKYKDDAQIYITLDAAANANMYVYQGNERRNYTKLIESNSNAPTGAPIRVPISEGAIVVLQTANINSATSSATFSYRVEGTEYNWYEKPFIGDNQKYYIWFQIAMMIAISIVVLTILSGFFLFVCSPAIGCTTLLVVSGVGGGIL